MTIAKNDNKKNLASVADMNEKNMSAPAVKKGGKKDSGPAVLEKNNIHRASPKKWVIFLFLNRFILFPRWLVGC